MGKRSVGATGRSPLRFQGNDEDGPFRYFISSPLVIERMATHPQVHAIEVITFKVRNMEIPHIRSAESAVGREREFRSFRIVNQQLPFAVGIDPNDLVSRGEL